MKRRKSKPTQAQLKAIGISQSFASEILRGKKLPSLTMAVRIQKELGYPVTSWEVKL